MNDQKTALPPTKPAADAPTQEQAPRRRRRTQAHAAAPVDTSAPPGASASPGGSTPVASAPPISPAASAGQGLASGQATLSDNAVSPKRRGCKIPLDQKGGRKALMRYTNRLLRKVQREWEGPDQPAQPGRIQATTMLIARAQALLDAAGSEEELAEADELHRLLQEMKGGSFGHA